MGRGRSQWLPGGSTEWRMSHRRLAFVASIKEGKENSRRDRVERWSSRFTDTGAVISCGSDIMPQLPRCPPQHWP